MSYLENSGSNNKTATIIAVTILEAAIILGVAAGLATNFKRDEMTILRSKNIPIPEVSPSPEVKPKPQEKTAVQKEILTPPLNPQLPQVPFPNPTFTPAPEPTFPTGLTEPPVPPVPQPSATVAPRNAQALGNPGNWATPDDYPSRDLREGNQGVTRFQLTIGINGRVESCRITSSSGFPSLDATACAKISDRARFKPATDSAGAKVSGTYSGRIRWEIPE